MLLERSHMCLGHKSQSRVSELLTDGNFFQSIRRRFRTFLDPVLFSDEAGNRFMQQRVWTPPEQRVRLYI